MAPILFSIRRSSCSVVWQQQFFFHRTAYEQNINALEQYFIHQNFLQLLCSWMAKKKGHSQPHIVCCAIPITRGSCQVLLVTSCKHSNSWVCESYPFLNYSVFFLSSCSTQFWCYIQYLKVVENHQIEFWRPQCLERRLKKVLPFAPLSVSPPPDSLLPPSLLLTCPCCSSLFKQQVYVVLLHILSPQYRQLQQCIIFMSWTLWALIKSG